MASFARMARSVMATRRHQPPIPQRKRPVNLDAPGAGTGRHKPETRGQADVMKRAQGRLQLNHAVALVVVLALHGALLFGLWSARVIPPPAETVTLFVNLIHPPSPQPRPEAATKPAPKPIKRDAPRPAEPEHYHLAAKAPVVSPTEATEPLPPPEPAVAAPESGAPELPSPPQAAGPVTLKSDLALVCPVRTPPPYPPLSLRLGETGKVVLRVELDEAGRVSTAQVITSSGFKRLDTAAIAAVKTWRCQPAQSDGQSVRSVALQPFNFTLEGR